MSDSYVIDSSLEVLGDGVNPGEIKFSDGTNTVDVKAPTTLSSDVDFVLPDSNGSTGNVLIKTATGTGWSTPASSRITYALQPMGESEAINTTYTTIARFTWLNSLYSGYSSGSLIYEVVIGDRNLDIRIRDTTNASTVVEETNVSTSSFREVTGFVNPVSNASLELQIRKTQESGTNPIIRGIQLEWDN